MDDDGARRYDAMTFMYVPEEEDVDASGLYIKVHEVIAMLRNEALLTAREAVRDIDERAEDALDALADALAESSVTAMDQFGEMGLWGHLGGER